MTLTSEIQDKLLAIKKDIETGVLPAIENASNRLKYGNITLEEYAKKLAGEELANIFIQDPRVSEIVEKTYLYTFTKMAEGTEFEIDIVLENFKKVLESVDNLFTIEIIPLNSGIDIEIEIPEDALGTLNDWASAILELRDKKFNKSKDPMKASRYWENIVWGKRDENSLFENTMRMRLSMLPKDSAGYLFALENGTGGQLDIVSRGGYPTPEYTSRGVFSEEVLLELRSSLQKIVDVIYNGVLETEIYRILKLLEGSKPTDTLVGIVKKLGVEAAEQILERSAKVNINKAIGVIINIDSKYYDIIKTSAGRLGIRYSLTANRGKIK